MATMPILLPFTSSASLYTHHCTSGVLHGTFTGGLNHRHVKWLKVGPGWQCEAAATASTVSHSQPAGT